MTTLDTVAYAGTCCTSSIVNAYSSGNLEGTKRFLAAAKPGFQVLTGSASVLADSLAAGCPGAILALANAVPYACISIYEAHRTREPAPHAADAREHRGDGWRR